MEIVMAIISITGAFLGIFIAIAIVHNRPNKDETSQ